MSLGEKAKCQLVFLHLDKGKQMNNSPVGMLEILEICKKKNKKCQVSSQLRGKAHATKPANNSSFIPGTYTVKEGNTFPKANL